MNKTQKGFTLIELLIVVAIIGILAAIAIPNLLTAMQRSKQKRTMADVRTIATAWEARATDVNRHDFIRHPAKQRVLGRLPRGAGLGRSRASSTLRLAHLSAGF